MKRFPKKKSYVVILAALGGSGSLVARAQTTPVSLTGNNTTNGVIALDNGANWPSGTVPTSANEAEIPSGYTGFASPNYNAGFGSSQTFGNLIVNLNSPLNIGNYSTTNGSSYVLTLSGSSGTQAVADGGAASDLLLIGSNVTSGTTINIGANVYGSAAAASTLGIALAINGTFDVVNAGVTAVISSNLSGTSFSLDKTGSGTLSLTNGGVNGYSGGTTIDGGVLQVVTTNDLGPSLGATINAGAFRMAASISSGRSFNVNSGFSTIDVSSGRQFTLTSASAIIGTGTLNVNGTAATDTGLLELVGTNTYTGGTNVLAGTLDATKSVSLPGYSTGAVSVSSGATLAVAYGGATDFTATQVASLLSSSKFASGSTFGLDTSNDSSGITYNVSNITQTTLGFAKLGTNALTLIGTGVYTGATNISGGTLQLGNGAAGNDPVLATSSYVNSGTLAFNYSGSASAGYNVSSSITGSGGLLKFGANTLNLIPTSGTNAYTGGTNISAGTVQFFNNAALGTSGTILIGAATLQYHRTGYTGYAGTEADLISLASPLSTIEVGDAGLTDSVVTTGVISGTGTLNKTGIGTLYLAQTGTNTYSGGTNISSGTVDIDQYTSGVSPTALSSGPVTIGAGTLQYYDTSYTYISGYNNSNSIILSARTSAVEIGTSTGSSIYAFTLNGVISGTGTLNKTGTGTLYVSPTTGTTNTYSGGTNIASGTIDFTTIRGLPTTNASAGAIIMANGTTFEYDGANGTTNALNTFNISGTVNLTITGALFNYGVISGSGQLVKKGTSTLEFIAETPGTTNLTANTYTGGTNISAGTIELFAEGYELPSTGTVLMSPGTTLEFFNTSTSTLAQSLPNVPFVLGNSSGGTTYFQTYASSNGAGFNLTVPGTISGAGLIDKTGFAGLILTNANNNYSGGTLVNAGSLIGSVPGAFGTGNLTITPTGTLGNSGDNVYVTSNGSIGSTAVVTVSSSTTDGAFGIGTLNLNGSSPTFASLAGNGVVVLNSPAGTTLTTGTASSTFSGTIKDGTVPGSVVISGPGTFTVSGTNTYSGTTNVSSGTLLAGATNSLSRNSAVLVSGGILDVSGYNNSIASLTVTSAGTVNLGLGNVLTTAGAASLAGTLNLSGTAGMLPENLITYTSETGKFTTFNGVPAGDALSYTGTALQLVTVVSGPGNLVYNDATGSGTFDTTNANFYNGTSTVVYSDTSNGAAGGDNVTFDDTASPNYNVSISSVVRPSALTVNTNSSTGYVFTGPGGIAGLGNLTKLGTGLLTLDTSNSYTGGTNISAGRVTLGVAGALPNGGNLTIAAGAVLYASNLGSTVALTVGSLNLAGKLDLNNNALIVHSSTIGAMTTLVASGYNGGMWNNSTGITSQMAAHDTTHLTALGVIQNSVDGTTTGTALYGSGSAHGLFEGTSPVDTDVLVKYTYYGDTDLNGTVDGSDYSRIDAAYLADNSTPGSVTGWYNGDFNYDGVIDGSDYTLMDNAFNQQGAQIAAVVATPTAQIAVPVGTSAVPEPATLGAIGMAIAGLLGRRRRM